MRLRSYGYLAAALAVGQWLTVGCRSAAPSSGAAAAGGARAERGTLERRADAHAHYAAGVVQDLRGESAEALAEYSQAVREDPDDDWLALEVSQRFLQDKKPDQALEVLTRAAARPGASGAVFARLGFVYAQLDNRDKAIEANRTAIRKAPRLLSGYRNLFQLYLKNQQAKEALRVLDDAAKQPAATGDFWVGLGDLYASYLLEFPTQGEAVRARGLAALARVEPSSLNLQLRLALADELHVLGDEDKAAQLYRELLKALEGFPAQRDLVRAKLTDIYLRLSDRRRAAEQLEAIVREDPANARAYYCLGVLALEDRRWADAAEQSRKALLFSPGLEPAYYNLAQAQIELGRVDDALATLGKAGGRFAQSFELEYWQGMACREQKDYTAAIKHFTAAEVIAQATEPKLAKAACFQTGATYERKGDLREAQACFEKCIALDPEFADALNYLGYMWAEQGTNLDQARGLIERALKVEPRNAAFLDSLGWVLFKLNRPKEALDYILKAVELTETPDAILFDHLGDVYAALRETSKAREAWRRSLDLTPSDQVRKKLEGNP